MNKLKLFLLLLGIPAILCSFRIQNSISVSSSETQYIFIRPESVDPEEAPRSANVVIEAHYDTELMCICATLINAGTTVAIDCVNNSTNEHFGDVVSGTGPAAIPISGTSGCWTITFCLADGEIYIGEFIL